MLELAARSVTEGLLHPQLQHGGRTWLAYWGATIDESVQEALDAIAAALPAVCADAFDGDRDALVHDLYACAVDQIARDRLRTAGVRLGNRLMRNRPSAPELFLDGLTSVEPGAAAARGARRARAAAHRLGRPRPRAPLQRTVAPQPPARRARPSEREPGGSSTVVLELWLQAADDPTLALPTSLLHDGGDAVFGFLRSADPRIAVHRQLGLIEPVLAEGGLAFDPVEPTTLELDDDDVRFVLRTAIPKLEELGVPVLLPRNWVSSAEPAARQPHRDEHDAHARAASSRPTPSPGSTGSSRSATRPSPRRSWPSSRPPRSR